ncbi:MAG: hypothetical protein ACNA7G_13290 [Methylobacter sp.]
MNKNIIFFACLFVFPALAQADNKQAETDSAVTNKAAYSLQSPDTIIDNTNTPPKNPVNSSEHNSPHAHQEKQPIDIMTFCRTHTC